MIASEYSTSPCLRSERSHCYSVAHNQLVYVEIICDAVSTFDQTPPIISILRFYPSHLSTVLSMTHFFNSIQV